MNAVKKDREICDSKTSQHVSTQLSELWVLTVLFGISLMVRAAVGLHPYSGEETPPMFGDFEAQRHWMELAINLPARDWYRQTADNDLAYWGLDYPPLSGYASWLAGRFLAFVDSASVALHTSRGYETANTRAAMRATVLIADILVFFPALALFARVAGKSFSTKAVAFVVTLPALIIIDHGHFQYNSVSLGLFIFSLAAYLAEYDSLGAIFFCLSVYFKHMGLYYALALFALHLSRVVDISRSRSLSAAATYAARVFGAITAVTVVIFWPWLSDAESVTTVLRRLFPVSRGLYEDKVGNVWCSLSVVLKLQRFLSHDRLVLLCATATFVASLPFCVAAGRRRTTKTLLLAVSGCALAAYLFAFQVHEKQILLPLVPLVLLFDVLPSLCAWMSLAASASLFPLLVREGLVLAYVALTAMQCLMAHAVWPDGVRPKRKGKGSSAWECVADIPRIIAIPVLLLGIVLHVVLLTLPPPDSAPDILVLLLTSFCCAIFCGVYVAMLAELWIA